MESAQGQVSGERVRKIRWARPWARSLDYVLVKASPCSSGQQECKSVFRSADAKQMWNSLQQLRDGSLYIASVSMRNRRRSVKAKSQGKLELPAVTAALRSCFPTFRAGSKAKKPVSTMLAETEFEDPAPEPDLEAFADVEAFPGRTRRGRGHC